MGQEALHPVEEKASAAVQYLLPVSLAARGENVGGWDHTPGLGTCICDPLLQISLSSRECPPPPTQDPLSCRGAQIIFVFLVYSWPQMDFSTQSGILGTSTHLKPVGLALGSI